MPTSQVNVLVCLIGFFNILSKSKFRCLHLIFKLKNANKQDLSKKKKQDPFENKTNSQFII